MTVRRKSIRMSLEADDLLRRLYLEVGIPIDQYARRPEDLDRFVQRWNSFSGRADSPDDVLHYMRTKRKKHKWVTFDGGHKRIAALPDDVLTPEQWAHLNSVYEVECVFHDIGSDSIDHDEALASRISRAFASLTDLVLPGRYLMAILMTKRKRGDLPTIRDSHEGQDNHDRGPNIGFGDIDEIAS